jgi:thiosulfate/3-mercaptopyruvate sulfurtransferase
MSGSPFVSPDRLAAELASGSPPVLLDCRWQLAGGADRAAYDRGHLPGAAFVDLDRDLSAASGPRGRHPLPDPTAFQTAMRRCGVDDGRPVVAYDQGDFGGAARAWWLLGFFGHRDVRVLDGGLPAWAASGRPLDTEPPDPWPGDFTARPGHRPVLDAAGAARMAAAGVLLDARVPARYAGREEPVDPVAGHIPGARNAPMGELLSGGRLRPAAELRRRFEALGVRDGVPVGAYCGSGVVASQLVLALEAAGIPAALYPGSWSEWVADPSRPVAVGDGPGGPAGAVAGLEPR